MTKYISIPEMDGKRMMEYYNEASKVIREIFDNINKRGELNIKDLKEHRKMIVENQIEVLEELGIIKLLDDGTILPREKFYLIERPEELPRYLPFKNAREALVFRIISNLKYATAKDILDQLEVLGITMPMVTLKMTILYKMRNRGLIKNAEDVNGRGIFTTCFENVWTKDIDILVEEVKEERLRGIEKAVMRGLKNVSPCQEKDEGDA